MRWTLCPSIGPTYSRPLWQSTAGEPVLARLFPGLPTTVYRGHHLYLHPMRVRDRFKGRFCLNAMATKSLQIRFEKGQTCQSTFGLSEIWVRVREPAVTSQSS
eukprot:scaffold30017_cov31-Prasinocladus_malaysianus.AAC.1